MKVLRCWGQNKAPPLICVPRARKCHIQQKAPIAPLGLAAFYTEGVSVAKAWVKEMFQCTVIPRLPKRWGFDPLAKEPQNDNQKSIDKQLGGKSHAEIEETKYIQHSSTSSCKCKTVKCCLRTDHHQEKSLYWTEISLGTDLMLNLKQIQIDFLLLSHFISISPY